MRRLKLCTWNIEHFERVLAQWDAPKLRAISSEIRGIAADVVCIVEGPWSVSKLKRWLADPIDGLAGEWTLPTVPGTEALLNPAGEDDFAGLKALYGMGGNRNTGAQWIWFLVRSDLAAEANPVHQSVDLWRAFTGTRRWQFRAWGADKRVPHFHWRHPQVLRLTLGGYELECIGVHLKSKINKANPFSDGPDDLAPQYVQNALTARIKLTSEVTDLRRYIDARFAQEREPRIFVMGDLNDGPGREYFEREYLHHDLVGNIQGDVFWATRFLNHALFDFEDELRWTTEFRDKVEVWARGLPDAALPTPGKLDTTRKQLIDHILFTQALTGPGAGPKVVRRSGTVEHTVHERIAATLPRGQRVSDHRPVSVEIEWRTGVA
jgi:hypothetical protein